VISLVLPLLMLALEPDPSRISARDVCLGLMREGVLTKDAHGAVRLAPPLIVSQTEIVLAAAALGRVLSGAK